MSFRQRVFAAMLRHGAGWHDRLVADRKRALLSPLRGRVLEIGPGTGVNLPYLARDVDYVGVEPNPHLRADCAARARELGLRADVRDGDACALDLPDASVDAAFSTLVLCSVPDLDRALGELCRVLRPGGRFAFLEHVAAPRGTWRRRAQDAIQPLWSCLCDGCHPNREVAAAIDRAGFRVSAEAFELPMPIASPHVAGVAER